jgi:hypothetical protein
MTEITGNQTYSNFDHIMLRVQINFPFGASSVPTAETYQYFGIYAPPGTTFAINIYNWEWWQFQNVLNIQLSGATENERYLAIALLKSPQTEIDDDGAFNLFKEYYKYAYNFISTTQVNWSYDDTAAALTTNFSFGFDQKRTGAPFVSNQTIFALYPHQWKNLSGSIPSQITTYSSIRGPLKAYTGSSFQTKHNFNGIVPFLTYEVPKGTASAKLQTYINYDKTFDPADARIESNWKGNSNTYYHGKAVARAANLIPVFHQKGDFAARDSMIEKLKNELAVWYQGSGIRNFKYDSVWGGVVGSNPGAGNDFGASKFTDHHFHYGYFIYASAILAMFDPSFTANPRYKDMTDLLVREIFNPDRNNTSFPFLRHFDVYEGHSWANGPGGDAWWGNDEESSSEAMNAWAGIFLWGLATGNTEWINLAVYGYTTQYEAIKNYYFNMDGDIWSASNFNHKSVGILYDSRFTWTLHWTPQETQSVMGIQVLPLTPSMLYLGYNTSYAESFYTEYWTRRGGGAGDTFWRDIWLRFQSLFNAPKALADWETANMPVHFPDTFDGQTPGMSGDDGSSMSFSYHFINFFNSLGAVDTGYYADTPSFLVMNKSGERTYIAYNPDKNNSKNVIFKTRAGGNVGTMPVPAGAIAKTKDFTDFEYEYDRTAVTSDEILVKVLDSSGTPAASLVFDGEDFKTPNSVSDSYMDITLNYNYAQWKALIYTDNKSSFTTADLNFEGNIASHTVSGLVCSHNASDEMLPIYWRAVSSTITYTKEQLFDGDASWDYWNPMRDVSSFTDPHLNKDSEEIRFMDKRGFRYGWNSANNYGDLPAEWKIKIYFMSDFSKAIKTHYKANIVIEYLNE